MLRNGLEQLHLDRKVGDGILPRNNVKNLRRAHSAKQKEVASDFSTLSFTYEQKVVFREADISRCYFLIHGRLKKIRERTDRALVVTNEQDLLLEVLLEVLHY
ncbi:hypothetical protein Y032_1411g3869 [Ancylostoma ceylanicum]|nr:hypothetical protein Y032_1411g3869 [Ancylostoma ceylanicum]